MSNELWFDWLLERRERSYGSTSVPAARFAHTARQRKKYGPKWKPEQNARHRKAKGVNYLVCTDGATYMWIPRPLGTWKLSWQLIRITRRLHDH